MGHVRKKAAPSPLELLAIFTAKETGVTLPEIAERTHYARSSIIRWWKLWGRETAFVEAIKCEQPGLMTRYDFDALFPKPAKPAEAPSSDFQAPLQT